MNPKKKYHLFKSNKSFCVVPWTNFEVYTNGDIKTCSMGGETLGNINNQDIEDILQSDTIKRIKSNMLENKPDKNCVSCYHRSIEDKNFSYLRDHYNKLLLKADVDYENIETFDMHCIDLHWSNICNLRCIMCNPQQSSLIAKDEKEIITPVNKKSVEKIIQMTVKNQAKIKEIYLSGGEPFYIPYNVQLLKQLENKDVPLRINTNMQWKKTNPLLQVLKNFNNVQLTMSADAVGDKFNYIRNGADWNLFCNNLEYIKNNTNFSIRVNTIFSIINADCIDSLIDYFYNQMNITDMTINLVYVPNAMDPRNYPAGKKTNIISKLQKIKKTISNEHTNLLNNLENCIMQISLENIKDYVPTLDHVTKKHKTNWRQVFVDLV
jgi:radical SAM protein with 4Fe4S-binding SPASM domain